MADPTPERRLEEALAEEPWGDLRPLSTVPAPAPFPLTDAFPPALAWLREFVRATAVAKQVPVDLPAGLLLAVISLAISRKVEVEPQPGWREPVPIWSLIVLPSGERKSAGFEDMVRPVREWCRRRAEAMAEVCARHASKVRIASAKLAAAEKRAAKSGPEAASEAERLAVELKDLESAAPRPPALVASDATPQAVGLMLSRNNERALVASAEGAIVEVMLGRYSDGRPDLDMFLAAQAGDSIEIERVGRAPVRLARPALSMALAVQPEAVRGLYESRIAAGRGLLARFQTVWPAPMVGHRELRPAAVPSASTARYEKTISDLVEALPGTGLLPEEIDAWRRLGRLPDAVHVLRFDPLADEQMLVFRAEVERALDPEGHEAASRSWLSKLPGTVARIAGVLHAAAYGIERDRLIGVEIMRAAIAWGRHLWHHARRVDGLAGDDEGVMVAEKLVRWVRGKGVEVFSRRDAFVACRGALCTSADQVDAPLALLIERGWIRPLVQTPSVRPAGGRPPSPRFEVNPAALARGCRPSSDDRLPQNAQNSHNPGAGRNGVGSVGCVSSAPRLGGERAGGCA